MRALQKDKGTKRENPGISLLSSSFEEMIALLEMIAPLHGSGPFTMVPESEFSSWGHLKPWLIVSANMGCLNASDWLYAMLFSNSITCATILSINRS